MPGPVTAARTVLAVRRAVRGGLGGFTAAGVAVCAVWAFLLMGGMTFTLPLVGLVGACAAVVGAGIGALRVALASGEKVAAYVDWRLEAGGAVMAAVERGGGFRGIARGRLTAAGILECATPFLPRWASAVFLPVALALLLSGAGRSGARPVGVLVEFGAGGGGVGGGQAAEPGGPAKRLVLFRTKAATAEGAGKTDLDGLLNGLPEGPAEAPLPREGTETGGTGEAPGTEAGGGGTVETSEGAGATGAGKAPDRRANGAGSLSPEWIDAGRRYLEELRGTE